MTFAATLAPQKHIDQYIRLKRESRTKIECRNSKLKNRNAWMCFLSTFLCANRRKIVHNFSKRIFFQGKAKEVN